MNGRNVVGKSYKFKNYDDENDFKSKSVGKKNRTNVKYNLKNVELLYNNDEEIDEEEFNDL